MTQALLLALALALGDTPDASAEDAGTPQAAVDAGAPAAAPSKEKDLEVVAAAIDRMKKAADELKDFTATFYKREWKGKQLPEEVVALKYRASPRSVYFKWVGKTYKDQEVIWQRGWNGDRARAHPGTFPDITVNLPTSHWLMTRYTRHEVPNAGFEFTISVFARDLVIGRARPECVIRAADAGVTKIYDAPARCYELETDKARCPEMYAYRARLCVNEPLGVPAKIEVWDQEDGALRLIEEYGYGDTKVNVGLTDADFDPKNKAYDF